jgi:hypothetical protein
VRCYLDCQGVSLPVVSTLFDVAVGYSRFNTPENRWCDLSQSTPRWQTSRWCSPIAHSRCDVYQPPRSAAARACAKNWFVLQAKIANAEANFFASILAGSSPNRSSAVVTDTPRSFLQIVLHNLKLAANIDHQRDDPSNAPSEPRPPPIVRENGSGGLVWQRDSPV